MRDPVDVVEAHGAAFTPRDADALVALPDGEDEVVWSRGVERGDAVAAAGADASEEVVSR